MVNTSVSELPGFGASADLPSDADGRTLHATLVAVREAVYTEGKQTFERWRPDISRRGFLASGLNLGHYLALRRRELRSLQGDLVPWGLSSLGRCEAHVVPTLDAVVATLGAACGETPLMAAPRRRVFARGEERLRRNTAELFGPPKPHRTISIMVTLATEAADDYTLVRSYVEAGMDCARINCAHDSAPGWEQMIAHVRRANEELGCTCRVLMDIAGPKVRTEAVLAPKKGARLHDGDHVLLTRAAPVEPLESAFQAQCSVPTVLDVLRPGDPVWIDDGKIGARVERSTLAGVELVITHARPQGEKLKAEKGLNFPESDLQIGPLTDQDLLDLDFIAQKSDLVGYSFIREPGDIALLQQELTARTDKSLPLPPLIAKIETRRAVENLPGLIVQAAGRQPLGVMIARGDLAVEIGYQRLAEIQEEILWLCEAAHVPVIWATQVLEQLVTKGTPSRAEMTDAAMSERAECVMLNKEPFVIEAIRVLDELLPRMQSNQAKKTPLLRALRVWRGAA